MIGKPRFRVALTIVGALLVADVISQPAQADGGVPADDVQAVARSIGFLESVPHDGTIFVGIVYGSATPNGKAAAAATAEQLAAITGPKSGVFRTIVMNVDDLVHNTDRLDAIFLMPGTGAQSGTVAETVRQRHLVSISNDPACLDAKCCVLMVRAGQRLEIVLDTALADAIGARFSTVFTMMVKRK